MSSIARGRILSGCFKAMWTISLLCAGAMAHATPPAATTTTLAVSAASVASGTVITLTATVQAGTAGVHPGLVAFCEASSGSCATAGMGLKQLGSAQLSAQGTASIKVRLGVGSHSLRARFMGTNSAAGSTSAPQTVAVTGVAGVSTALTIQSSGSAPNYTLTGVLGNLQNFGSTLPGGAVTFTDTTNGNRQLGTASLATGSLGWSLLPQTNIIDGVGEQGSINGSTPKKIVVADFNGDGIPDFAIADTVYGVVGVFLGKGDGTFQTELTQGAGPFSLAVADFNGDGIPDLAVTTNVIGSSTSAILILIGKGDGTFTVGSTYPLSATLGFNEDVAIGDFNGDGIADLAVVNGTSSELNILLGKGDGTFQTAVSTSVAGATQLWSVVAVDLNGDGVLDLAATDWKSGKVVTMIGVGDGTFQSARGYAIITTANEPFGLVAGDFNGDGFADIAVATRPPDISVATQPVTIEILTGSGDGSLHALASYNVGTSNDGSGQLAVGDFNGDGITDLATASEGPFVHIHTNYGVNGPGTLQVLLGKGDATFQAAVNFPTGIAPISIAVGDMNGDGLPDILVGDVGNGDYTTSYMGLLLGDRTQTVSLANVALDGPVAQHTVTAAYAGDSNFTASSAAGIPLTSVLTTTALAISPAAQVNAGQTFTLTATVTPPTAAGSSGTLTTSGQVNFFDGAQPLGSGTLANGQATFSTSLASPGLHFLNAVYSGDSTFSTSQPALPLELSVHPLVAVATTLTLSSASVALGTAVTLTANVAYGTSPVFPGTVNFCDAAAPHCADTALLGTAMLNSSGVAVVKLRLGVGTHSIQAVFAGTTAFPASSSTPKTLTVTGPSGNPSSLALSTFGAPPTYRAVATLTNSAAASVAMPTGTLSLVDTTNGNAVLATQPLSAATTSLQAFSPAASCEGPVTTVMATGDFNGDGIPDAAIAISGTYAYASTVIDILLGSGDGNLCNGYAPTLGMPATSYATAMAVGDVNGDGIPDLIVSDAGLANTVTADQLKEVGVYLGNGDGTFKGEVWYPTGQSTSPLAVVLADVNGDGIPDILVANAALSGNPYPDGSLGVMLGKGDGTFQPMVAYSTGPKTFALALAAGDFNGDGKTDVAVLMNYNGYGAADYGAVEIFLNNGDGTFKPPTTYGQTTGSEYPITFNSGIYTSATLPDSIVVGDFNRDGFPDIAITSVGTGTAGVLLNKGDGTFPNEATYTIPNGTPIPMSLAAADFDGDGKLDLAVGLTVNSAQTIDLLTGNGDGTFQQPVAITGPAGFGPHFIAVADANGDGRPDILAVNNIDRGTASGSITPLINGRGQSLTFAGVTIPGPVNNHNVVAMFAADANYAAATSATRVLTSIRTILGVISSFPSSPAYTAKLGQTISLSADLEHPAYFGSLAVSGSITYFDGGTLIGTATIANGQGILHTSFSTPGAHILTASYSGDTNFGSSTTLGTTTITVTAPPATTTTLSASTTNALPGGSVTFTATVASTAGTPTGTVTFLNGTASLGTATLNGSGVATFTTTALPQGADSITASYASSDGSFAASTSASLVVNIGPLTTATMLSASPTSTSFGGLVTLTASVISATGTPTGTITFLNGSSTLGTGTLNSNGLAVLATTALPVGNDSVTASYAGTTTFAASVSPAATVKVSAAATTTSLSASSSSASFGGSVTFTATVSSAGGTPAGTVTFLNGTTTLGTATLNASGLATFSAQQLPVGADAITAAYAASGNFAASTSNATTVTVSPAGTATALSASASNIVSGASVTLTATVTSAAGTPAGTVTFLNGTAALGTGTLNASGVATFSTTTLPVGADAITAAYAASGNFASSTSSSVTVTVTTPPPPSFTLTASPSTLTIKAGQSGTTVLTLTPSNGYNSTVALSCSGLPTGATCVFSPSSLTPVNGQPANSTLTVTTTAAKALLQPHPPFRVGAGSFGVAPVLALLLPGAGLLLGAGLKGRATQVRLFSLSLLLLLAAVGLNGCGSSSGSGTNSGTPPGTNAVTITASAGAGNGQTFVLAVTITP